MFTPTVADRVLGCAPLRRRQATGRALAHLFGRLDVHGLDLVPARGAVVLAVNHRAFLDGPLLFGLLNRPVTFLVKAEAFTPRLGPVLRSAGQIPVVRERPDPAAVRLCVRILRGGGVVGIFPEGTRGDGLARTARPGVGYLALRTGATVLPVACHGTDALGGRAVTGRPQVRITIGAPIDVTRIPDGVRVRRRDMLETTETVRAALARLVRDTEPHRDGRSAAA